MVVLVDDEDRGKRSDLAMAAEKITPDPSTSWPSTPRLDLHPLTEERCDELRLPLMSPINTSVHARRLPKAWTRASA